MDVALNATMNMLHQAFPHGLNADDYFPLLALLYPHMGHGPLASVVAELSGREKGVVLNDVFRVGAGVQLTPESVEHVLAALRAAGFDDWVLQEP